jgi:tyrosyl-tRNA synthetase
MSGHRSDFTRTVSERGFIYQCTDLDALDAAAADTLTGYIGFDCTATSLHVGSLVSIMLLRWFQRCGHRPIVLLGGGTSKIGDPSGKDEARQLLTEGEIAANMAGIRRVFERFLKVGDGPTDAQVVNNAEWLDRLEMIPFLRDYGRHFSVNRMLSVDSVKMRLEREQPLSFLEFNYMILQAYDFFELARSRGCTLQMGGSDQWGNIVAGVDLARRVDGSTLFGLTTPLITSASGAKMGKSATGAVWLEPDLLAPYAYWQYWRNVEDADVGRFLKLFTELPLDEVDRLAALQGSELNHAKTVLANEATRLAHGEAAAAAAADTARQTFDAGGAGDDLPTIELDHGELSVGVAAFDLLRRTGLAQSNSEARRLIKGGGARLNNQPIASETRTVSLDDVDDSGLIKLSAGRKRHALVRIRP